jgi:hypothetical protein
MALKARKRILLSYDSKVCEKPWRVFKQKTELAAFVFWEQHLDVQWRMDVKASTIEKQKEMKSCWRILGRTQCFPR